MRINHFDKLNITSSSKSLLSLIYFITKSSLSFLLISSRFLAYSGFYFSHSYSYKDLLFSYYNCWIDPDNIFSDTFSSFDSFSTACGSFYNSFSKIYSANVLFFFSIGFILITVILVLFLN